MYYYLVEMDNGYASCGIEFIICSERELRDDEIDATYADEFDSYCNEYCYVAQGYDIDGERWKTDEDEMAYYDSCNWSWYEIEENEIEDYGCEIVDFAN